MTYPNENPTPKPVIMEEIFECEHIWEPAGHPKFPDRYRCQICGVPVTRLMGVNCKVTRTCFIHGDFVEDFCPKCDPPLNTQSRVAPPK
jgi:hypothetical protein